MRLRHGLPFLGLLGCLLQAAPAGNGTVRDLPIIEVRPPSGETDTFAVLLSGDGGWAGLDREVARALAERGYPVVGLSSLRYFWKARTPDSASLDLQRLLAHYLSAWHKRRAVLIGYSYGADVLPFMVNRLPSETRAKVPLVALIGLGDSIAFEFHLSGWLGWGPRSPELPVLPELRRLRGPRVLCLCGEDERDSPCRASAPGLAKVEVLPGAHHFGGNYRVLAEAIVRELAPEAR